MTNELCLEILGTTFSITVDEDEEYLKKVLLQYQTAVKNTQNISGIKDPLNVAVLTGFLLCDEVNKIKLQLEDELKNEEGEEVVNQEIHERTVRLISKLDQALRLFGENEPL